MSFSAARRTRAIRSASWLPITATQLTVWFSQPIVTANPPRLATIGPTAFISGFPASQRDQVVANGKLVSFTIPEMVTVPNVWKFDEAKSIPPYCMVIAVNQGAIIDSPDRATTNLLYDVPQRDRAFAAKGFSPAAPALAFFSETIAPYPYEKLALIIGATRFGGMENSSAIVFTSTLFDSRGNEQMSKRFGIPARTEDVVAHEIAHQWFGDSVTESTWADLWLSEGFATYFAG